MIIRIHEHARQDLLVGHNFYEESKAGLGAYFIESLMSDIDSLQLFAGIHSIHFGYFRMLSKRFPFAIFYEFDGEMVLIEAVIDCRRDPEWIESRLV